MSSQLHPGKPLASRIPLPPPQPTRGQLAGSYLVYCLFIVANAFLYTRPTEYMEGFVGVQLFLVLMVLCILLGFPLVLGVFARQALTARPMLTLALLMWPLVVLSDLGKGRPEEAITGFLDFARIIPYYLLLLAVVTTPERLRYFLGWICIFSGIIAGIAILQYHEILNLTLFAQLQDNQVKRLQATGLFQDPNDLGALLVFTTVGALFFLRRGSLITGPFWVGMIGVYLYAIYLTHSRGTLLALGAALFFLLRARIGTFSALMLGVLMLPGLFLFSGRKLDLSSQHNTAMTRIGHWSDAMVEFTRSPIFGTGYKNLHEYIDLVAHNSYLHAFAELGFVGGCVFLGLFLWPLWRLLTLDAKPRVIVDPELAALHPTMLAALAGYMVSIFSLSLCYVHPTYTILGLMAAYLHMTTTQPAMPPARLSDRFFLGLAVLGVLFLAFMKVFIPVMRVVGG